MVTASSFSAIRSTVNGGWFVSKLFALQVKLAKPKTKQDKLTDGEGIDLLVVPNGSEYWRYSYRYLDKRKPFRPDP